MDRRVAFLLGAGASSEAGVPMTLEMTRRMVERFEGRPWDQAARALFYIVGATTAEETRRGVSPLAAVDIERVVTAAELLADRENLEVTPFIAAWDPAVDTVERRELRLPPGFDRKFGQALTGRRPGGVGQVVLDLLREAQRPTTGGTYRRLVGEMVGAIPQLVAITQPERTDYLRPMLEILGAQGGGVIGTLNYDRSVELAAQRAGVHVDASVPAPELASRTDGAIRLVKLHGSVDWYIERMSSYPAGAMPAESVITIDPKAEPEVETMGRRPALIFGGRGKLAPMARTSTSSVRSWRNSGPRATSSSSDTRSATST